MTTCRWDLYNSNLIAELAAPAAVLAQETARHRGVRVGESTVVSRKLHTINPLAPQEVQILQHADAGQFFYGRARPDEIYHLDIFHAPGMVEHTRVAGAIKKAVHMYNTHMAMCQALHAQRREPVVCADYIDIQTGTGGGRVTGTLRYGRKASLRQAHMNHVHIAALLSPSHTVCLFYLVWAVEREVIAAGYTLRRNERLVYIDGDGGRDSLDLSPYTDNNDSFLRTPEEQATPGAAQQGTLLQHIGELAEECDSPQTLTQMLDKVRDGTTIEKLQEFLVQAGASERILDYLTHYGYIEKDGKTAVLTAAGEVLHRFLRTHAGEISAYFRRILRSYAPCPRDAMHRRPRTAPQGLRGPAAALKVCRRQDGTGVLDVAATVMAAAGRTIKEQGSRLAIGTDDLRYVQRRRYQPWEFCLLVDASASMAGSRIQAAKYLARHLLVSSRDKVAVGVFQETTARIVVPFTRDYEHAVGKLAEITAFGSTPLAQGLDTAADYLRQSRVKSPVLLVITDGVPTVAAVSRDALADAVAAAKRLRRERVRLICVGLRPQQNYLQQIAQAAGGVVYVLDELEKHALTRVVWSPRAVFCL